MNDLKIKKIQEVIDSTDYWDCKVLNLNVMYFGDCLTLYIEDNETYCWKMQFLSCYIDIPNKACQSKKDVI